MLDNYFSKRTELFSSKSSKIIAEDNDYLFPIFGEMVQVLTEITQGPFE
jgi:hypothetical protein